MRSMFGFADIAIGGMTMNTTVLVKAWEPTLEQYVLIRRPARFAVFGNLLDAYTVDERLDAEGHYDEDLLDYKRNLNDLTPSTKYIYRIVKGSSVLSDVYAFEMPGSRYDIGNLESYREVQREYIGIKK